MCVFNFLFLSLHNLNKGVQNYTISTPGRSTLSTGKILLEEKSRERRRFLISCSMLISLIFLCRSTKVDGPAKHNPDCSLLCLLTQVGRWNAQILKHYYPIDFFTWNRRQDRHWNTVLQDFKLMEFNFLTIIFFLASLCDDEINFFLNNFSHDLTVIKNWKICSHEAITGRRWQSLLNDAFIALLMVCCYCQCRFIHKGDRA